MAESDQPQPKPPARRSSKLPVGLIAIGAVALVAFSPNVDVECNPVHMLTESNYVCFHNGDRGWGIWSG